MKWPYLAAVIAYCALILWNSSRSVGIPSEYYYQHMDKPVHFVIYGVLAALISVGMYRSGKSYSLRMQLLLPWAFASLFGLIDECYQLTVPGRHFELLDIAANMSGACAAQLLLCFVWWRLHKSGAAPAMQLRSSEAD